MLKRNLLGLLFAGAVMINPDTSSAAVLPPPTLTLAWDYPQLFSNVTFNVYGSTNPGLPLRQWQLLTKVNDATTCRVPAPAGNYFYFVTASNTVNGMETGFGN